MVSEAIRPVEPSRADGARGLQILAVSDDLTGAAALAGEFRAAGLVSCVATAEHATSGMNGAEALVVDSRSRHLPPRLAARAVERALDGRDAQPGSYYKRVDSALRGNVADELAAVAGFLGRALVLATAAPALGVVTRRGAQHAVASAEDTSGARLAELAPGSAVEIPLDQIRGWGLGRLLAESVAAGRHVVCDAESEADLVRVASALTPLADRVVPVGSYGFGRAWASAIAGPRAVQPGVLVVVGSIKPASRRQIERARERGALVVYDAASSSLDAASALSGGRDVVLVSTPERPGDDLREDPAVAERLAERAVGIAATHAPLGIVLVGGELSSAFLGRAGTHRGRVVVEPWPAAPVLRLHGGILDGQRVVTKSGAQGDDGWLNAALAVVRSLDSVGRGGPNA